MDLERSLTSVGERGSDPARRGDGGVDARIQETAACARRSAAPRASRPPAPVLHCCGPLLASAGQGRKDDLTPPARPPASGDDLVGGTRRAATALVRGRACSGRLD
ncbi:unnamed protein product [Urochloa humidicola]